MWWVDESVRRSLTSTTDAPAALELYAHVLGAEILWLDRIEEKQQSTEVWPEHDSESCTRLAGISRRRYEAFLKQLQDRDLLCPVRYTNSVGQEFENRLDDMLVHMALHGSYHRGQISLVMRQAGVEPCPTDYIASVGGTPAATRR